MSDERRYVLGPKPIYDYALTMAQLQCEIDRLAQQPDPPPPDAPQRGADVDAWLDYRAEKKAEGTWYRLAQIAQWSGFSESKLKRKSSERKPRGTPKPAPEKQKKFGS